MPDTTSRIKLEAQGADQAAREIRKLKEAYEEVALASKGIGASVGGGDPFSRATSPPGGVGGAPINTPASVPQRQAEDERWRNQVQQRQHSNSLVGTAHGGVSMAEQIQQGQYGSAAGGALKGVGAMLGGGAAIGLGAAAVLAIGTQKLANNEYERVQRIWGGGVSQRLGLSYNNVRDWEANMGRQGIPLESLQQFTGVLSQTGFNTADPWASNASRMAMEALVATGVDAGTTGSLLGALSRGGVGLEAAGYDMYSRGRGAVGDANLGRYIQELTKSMETMNTQGISVTPEGFTEKATFLSSLSLYGGMSPDAANATYSRLESRGIAAATLSRPEDLIAFNAMRGQGMTMTDTMALMESDPETVNRQVYEYLRSSYGAGSDELRLRFQKYAGGTMSSTIDTMETYERTRGMTPEELKQDTAKAGENWMRSGKSADEERVHTAARNAKILLKWEATALDITTSLAGLREIFQGETTLSTVDITWKGGSRNRFANGLSDDVLPGTFVTDNVLIDNPEAITILGGIGNDLGLSVADRLEAYRQGTSEAQMLGGYGDWDAAGEAAVNEMLNQARSLIPAGKSGRAARDVINQMSLDLNDPETNPNFTSFDDVNNYLSQMVALLSTVMPVYTDAPNANEYGDSSRDVY